jgi:lipopolysaccharide biosynthesis glycosyltransferase
MNAPIRIVMSADRNYLIPLEIALASVRHNLPHKYSLNLTVLSADLTATDIGWRNKGPDDSLTVTRPFLPERTRTPISGHISRAAYFRLCLEYSIAPEITRVIYLDCDLVVNKDISELWAADLCGKIIGAVEDYSLGGWDHPGQHSLLELLNQEPILPYFNSGVLVIDTGRWRSCGVMGRAFDFINAHPAAVPLWDQDALNAVLCDNWHQLDPRWNRPSNYRWLRDQGKLRFSEDQVHSLDSPYVFHFVSGSKPWSEYRHPDKAVFDHYARIAGHSDFRFTLPKAILRKAKSILSRPPTSAR